MMYLSRNWNNEMHEHHDLRLCKVLNNIVSHIAKATW